jgi:protein-L-isoaspartate(D-aspartate) O-methyltransferase
VTDYRLRREHLIESLISRGYLTVPAVIEAMRVVPREEFVPSMLKDEAYADTPLPIGEGQTISAPHMVAIMVEALDLRPGQKVLEVGAGSGYHASVAAQLVAPTGHIYTVERVQSLVDRARENIARAGFDKLITVTLGDGSMGWEENAPYDRIFVACGAPKLPKPLVNQLADGGKMLIPVGGRFYQDLVKIERRGQEMIRTSMGGCVFVPLIGECGY